MINFQHMALVAAGGALGATLRWLSGLWIGRVAGGFPYGTLFVNVLGGFVMGLAAVWLMERAGAWRALSPFVMTGLLGGFTTFSAFSLDTLHLLERGEAAKAGLYVGLSVALSIAALWAGLTLARSGS